MNIFTFMARNVSTIAERLIQHIQITVFAIGIAIVIGVPLGILVSYIKP